jgi:dUTP pyrophosphatase
MTEVRVQRVRTQAQVPVYMTKGAAGCDVTACLEESLEIGPGKRVAVPTGLAFAIPEGYEIQVRPRSGLSFKRGLTVVNAPGTIDSDYRGEVMVLMINLGEDSVRVEPGDRIAQLVLQRVEQISWLPADSLDETARASGGFGSTGVTSART